MAKLWHDLVYYYVFDIIIDKFEIQEEGTETTDGIAQKESPLFCVLKKYTYSVTTI